MHLLQTANKKILPERIIFAVVAFLLYTIFILDVVDFII